MGKILPGLVVSFVSQKGGSGKTTLTTLFANYLQSTSKKTNLKIAVIDCDNEQNSLYNMRQNDVIHSEKMTRMRIKSCPLNRKIFQIGLNS